MTETITVLPQSNERSLCVRLSGMIDSAEYLEKFASAVERMAATNKDFDLLVFYDEQFKGWSREAADLSFKNFSQFSPKARRLAYVNAPQARVLMMKMMQPITEADVRYFERDELDDALSWIRER